MKIDIINSIDEYGFDIAFLPTIIFSTQQDEKSLSLIWLCFEIDIKF